MTKRALFSGGITSSRSVLPSLRKGDKKTHRTSRTVLLARGIQMTFRTADATQPEAALAVLELYLHAKESAGPSGRFAMAGGFVVLTALTGVIFGVATFMWRPLLEAMN
jgi:hypothetical protein